MKCSPPVNETLNLAPVAPKAAVVVTCANASIPSGRGHRSHKVFSHLISEHAGNLYNNFIFQTIYLITKTKVIFQYMDIFTKTGPV